MPGLYFKGKPIMRQRIITGIILATFLLLPAIFYYSPYPIIMGASEGIISGSFIVLRLVLSPGWYTGSQFQGKKQERQ